MQLLGGGYDWPRAEVAELADAPDSKSGGGNPVWVQVPPSALSALERLHCMAERLGILTGGGDCPGLNAVIRAVARRSLDRGSEVIAIRAGWRGLVEAKFEPLGPREISGILPRGGTIIGTSRTNPYKIEGGVDRVLAN